MAGQRTLRYEFPALAPGGRSYGQTVSSSGSGGGRGRGGGVSGGCAVELTSRTPTSYDGTGRDRVDDSCNGYGRGNTGVALWEGSFVLAEWLSRQATPLSSDEVAAALEAGTYTRPLFSST